MLQGAQPFHYSPLASENSIRLITIQPETSAYGLLICTLSHVEFGSRPSYEALSYTWGDNLDHRPIILDGRPFYVGINLFDALHYLRRDDQKKTVWADAICINQDDIPERSAQIQIMPHIYTRADTVIVWLGDEIASQNLMPDMPAVRKRAERLRPAETTQVAPEAWVHHKRIAGENYSPEVGYLASLVRKNDYWQRLWIIQEIAKPNEIHVCCSSRVSWDDLLCLMVSEYPDYMDTGPLRLDNVRSQVRSNDCRLMSLVLDHQRAKCRDPRDKIYGLKGLAKDAIEFPVDYRKPLTEVWHDAMVFFHQKESLPNARLISLGAQMKSMLLGDTPVLSQSFPQHPCVHSGPCPTILHLRGHVIGKVSYVGTSLSVLEAKPKEVDEWEKKIHQTFPNDDQAAAESQLLLSASLKPDHSRKFLRCHHRKSGTWITKTRESIYSSRSEPKGESAESAASADDDSPRLFHLRSTSQKGSVKMGIASSQTREGDLLVWVPEFRPAIVVRPLIDTASNLASKVRIKTTSSIFGFAWVTEDVARTELDHAERLKHFSTRDIVLKMNVGMLVDLLIHDDTK